jgi:hypothetical protein
VRRLRSLLRDRDDTQPWTGAYAPYDLIKELCIAVGVMALLAVLLADAPAELPHYSCAGAQRHQSDR